MREPSTSARKFDPHSAAELRRRRAGDAFDVVDLGPALGTTLVVFSDAGLVGLRAWNAPAEVAELRAIGADIAAEGTAPAAIVASLTRYGRGEPVDPAELPVDLRGSPFYVAVWRALLRVRRGTVRTYQGLAADAGSPRAMRAVGQAMAHNPLPIVVPCHRVVARGGLLGGYTGGLDRKRVLLALEGVAVTGDRVHAGQLDLLR